MLRRAARGIYRRLMDAVDPNILEQAETALQVTPGVVSVDQARLRWIGHRMHAEATVTIDHTLDVIAADAIADAAEHVLRHQVPRLDRPTVHINHAARPRIDDRALTGHHRHWQRT